MKSLVIFSFAIPVTLLIGVGIGFYFSTPAGTPVTTTITSSQNSILTSNPDPYFPTGFMSKVVNLTSLSSGVIITVGTTNFTLEYPSNIETRTSTIGSTSTIITVTADYQCGISLGQRIFFDTQTSSGTEVKLDYCLVLNNAVQILQRGGNISTSWSLWQIPLNVSPTVALHLIGNGEKVSLVELWTSSSL